MLADYSTGLNKFVKENKEGGVLTVQKLAPKLIDLHVRNETMT